MANAIAWFEIAVKDIEKATNFYSKVLDKPLQINIDHGYKLTVFPHVDNEVGGCIYEDTNSKANESLLVYFDVNKRIHDAVAKAIENGGKVVEDVTPLGEWGYRAIILDCCNNKIALHAKEEK